MKSAAHPEHGEPVSTRFQRDRTENSSRRVAPAGQSLCRSWLKPKIPYRGFVATAADHGQYSLQCAVSPVGYATPV